MTPFMIVAAVTMIVAAATMAAVIARVIYARRLHRRYLNAPIAGRQQQRAELRRLAVRAVGRAPVDRRIRRQAAREITQRVKRGSTA